MAQALSPVRLIQSRAWPADKFTVDYRRNLPHMHPQGVPLFITWRLFGSIAVAKQHNLLIADPTPCRALVANDRILGSAPGPRWLGDSAIAGFVARQIGRGDLDRNFYQLHVWVVMPNHVHILITPNHPVAKITRWLKGSTANYANRALQLRGHAFWQDESWDRAIRSGDEFNRIRRYIEHNPVSAGLVSNPADWPWSSAR